MRVSVLDPILVAALGGLVAFAYGRWLEPRNPDWYVVLNVVVVLAFWLHGAMVALGGVAPWGGAAPAADVPWLLAAVHVLSAMLWFKWGAERIFVLFGRSPRQGGVTWVLRLKDTTEPFEPDWED